MHASFAMRRRYLLLAPVMLTALVSCQQFPSMPMGHMGMGHHGHMMGGGVTATDPQSLPDKESAGARAFTRYCQQCHALPSPAQHTASEWPAVVQRMRGNIRNMGKTLPSEAELAEIVEYLRRNAKT